MASFVESKAAVVAQLRTPPEYRDILGSGEEEEDLRNLISTYKRCFFFNINDKIFEQAVRDVPFGSQCRLTTTFVF